MLDSDDEQLAIEVSRRLLQSKQPERALEVAKRAADSGISPVNLVMSASHTHAGPGGFFGASPNSVTTLPSRARGGYAESAALLEPSVLGAIRAGDAARCVQEALRAVEHVDEAGEPVGVVLPRERAAERDHH